MQGRTFSAAYDGELIHDNFQFHDWMLNMEPAPIRLQKHIVVHGDNLGDENPCPIEYRNIFLKNLGPSDATPSTPSPSDGRGAGRQTSQPMDSLNAALLARIDDADLPEGYEPAKHQQYVDRRMAELTEEQRDLIGRLWKEKEKTNPHMSNRGSSFVKILHYVAEGNTPRAKTASQEPGPDVPAKSGVRGS